MKTIKKIKYIILLVGISAMLFSACKKVPPPITKLQFDRAFSPVELAAKIRNKTTAELSWASVYTADSFALQISNDSLKFDTILYDVTVKADTFSILLNGNKQYSARVKTYGGANESDSKWASVAFKTLPENIFEPLDPKDVTAKSVTLYWPAGSAVTNLVIQPGDIQRAITDQEKTAGSATITGLTSETNYTVYLFNGANQRGEVSFKTLVDIGNATAVYPEDTLKAVIARAQPGDVLALFPGVYRNDTTIVLNKSISIVAVYPYDKPVLHAQFQIEDGASQVAVTNIDIEGDSTLSSVFAYSTSDGTFQSLKVTGCDINNFDKSLWSDGGKAFATDTVMFNNCFVTNIFDSGGDFIDSRKSFVNHLIVKNSTFSNCATVNTRDFIRMDGSTKGNSYDDGTRTVHVSVSNCTLYNVMNSTSSTKRFFYVRWSQQELTSESNLLVDMGISVYSNQSLTQQPTCSNNNYFNADGYYTANGTILIDNSSNYTTLDPGFVDAAGNNFTVTNQTLIDNLVGAPRWLGTGK